MGNLRIFELCTHAPKDNLIIVIVRQVIKRERQAHPYRHATRGDGRRRRGRQAAAHNLRKKGG